MAQGTNVGAAIETLIDMIMRGQPKFPTDDVYSYEEGEYARKKIREALWTIAGARPPEDKSTLDDQREVETTQLTRPMRSDGRYSDSYTGD